MSKADNIHVVVAMSGGVDSSVAALLLKEQGYRVSGLFMKNWEEDDTDTYCSAAQDALDAEQVCNRLHIPFHRVNFAQTYWENVFEHFLKEYKSGRTPNPDILCNKEIKFKAFLEAAKNLGADCIATGHYARRHRINDSYKLCTGLDNNKDQSYFLYTLGQAQLSQSYFPVGELQKPVVRQIAKDHGLLTHDKRDSTGICFIGKRNFKNFLGTYLKAISGNIETAEGEIIGKHQGLFYYTLGQRQGIGIGGIKKYGEEPWYVVAKDQQRNVLIVGQGHDHPLLFSKTLWCTEIHWISESEPQFPLSCQAKIRYRQEAAPCVITKTSNQHLLQVEFHSPQRAITSGQACVFYLGEECLGGGTIIDALMSQNEERFPR